MEPNPTPKKTDTPEFWQSRVQFWTERAKSQRDSLARAQAEDDHLNEVFWRLMIQSSEVQAAECAKEADRWAREQVAA